MSFFPVIIPKYYGIKYSDDVRVVMFPTTKKHKIVAVLINPVIKTRFVTITGNDITPPIVSKEQINKICQTNDIDNVETEDQLWASLEVKLSEQTYDDVMNNTLYFVNAAIKAKRYNKSKKLGLRLSAY